MSAAALKLGAIALGLSLSFACSGGSASTPVDEEAAAARAPEPPAPTRFSRTTQSGRYTLDIQLDPAVPKLGELFAVEAVVTSADGEPLEAGEVVMNARMPHHNHGMETDPVATEGLCEGEGEARTCSHPEGRYRSEGFKFHMGGEWTLTFEVKGPRGVDSTSFVYTLK